MNMPGRLIGVQKVPHALSAGSGLKLQARGLLRSRLASAEIFYGKKSVAQNTELWMWEDAFSIGVRYRAEVSHASVNGKRFDLTTDAGFIHILYLSGADFIDLSSRRHTIDIILTRAFMREIAEDLEVPPVTHLGNDACLLAFDPVLVSMVERIRPYFDDPRSMDALRADSFMWALGIYMMSRYGDLASHRPSAGALTRWQERLAKELIEQNLEGGISLDELAQCCGLRVSQFAHAFKRSTGVPPYRWLTQRRVARASEFMQHSGASLVDISERCGFSDQSHFTRVFSAHTGRTPAAWRSAL